MEYGHAFGVDHLTCLAIPPPEWVELAWSIGFDMVGIRLRPMSPHEDSWPMSPGSSMLRETTQRLSDLDIKVLDVEILSIDPQTTLASYRPMLEAAAMLQARHVLVVIDDPDEGRAVANLAELSGMAASYGMRTVIEPMSYKQVNSLHLATRLILAAGEPLAGIVADVLHLVRIGTNLSDLCALDPALLAYAQLSDALIAPPNRQIDHLPRHQSTEGGPGVIEARALRLLPGEGKLPLTDYLRALPADVPLVLETPNIDLQRSLSPREILERGYRKMSEIVGTVQALECSAWLSPVSQMETTLLSSAATAP